MKTTICIIRHGETDWNLRGVFQGREDIALNDTGRSQARKTVNYFKKGKWDRMVSSPLKRAYETAEIIGKEIGISDIQVVDEIIEKDFGSAAGMLPTERVIRFPDGIIHDEENYELLKARAMLGLRKIVEKNKSKRIIVVSHGGVIDSILSAILNEKYSRAETRLKNTCITVIHEENHEWDVEFYNKSVDELI